MNYFYPNKKGLSKNSPHYIVKVNKRLRVTETNIPFLIR